MRVANTVCGGEIRLLQVMPWIGLARPLASDGREQSS